MEHKDGPVSEAAPGGEDGQERADEGTPHDGVPEVGDSSSRTPRRSVPMWTAVVLIVLALGAGYLLGRPSYPLDTGPDAGFLRDMSAHHAQAVDMSMIILEKTEDPELHTVATDMALTQQGQIGIMQAWLAAWDLNSRGTKPPMAWMAGHDHGGGGGGAPDAMPGLASPEEMEALEEAEGVEAELLFLELMIAHHEGGIDMAVAEVEFGKEQKVVDLAQKMINGQRTEVDWMEKLIDERRSASDA